MTNITTPQILLALIWLASLCLSAYKHGKEKTGKENFWTTVIAVAIGFGLLYWGGWFDNLK